MMKPQCPKCGSSRIRRGYKPTPLLFRMVGIYNLLCDHCNLLFRGFAIPGTIPKPGTRRRKHRTQEERKQGIGRV
jgi:ribosomal protein L37AE/L43A